MTACAKRLLTLPAALLLFVFHEAVAQPLSEVFPPGGRVVFLGDSVTDAGGYIALIDAHLQTVRKPDTKPAELINVGLPSETCCGLSEPVHPFPRPDVHERLGRVLKRAEPDVVFACYGINDAIYHPFDESRFAAYQSGVERLVAACHAAGARVVLLTPPPFDPLPLGAKGKLVSASADEFSWKTPYEGYDKVVKRYADWLLAEGPKMPGVARVIDIHTPLVEAVTHRREQDPAFALSPDGVHIEDLGHKLLGEAILKALDQTPQPIDPNRLTLTTRRQKILHAAWLSHVGHKRPRTGRGLPLEEAKKKAAEMVE